MKRCRKCMAIILAMSMVLIEFVPTRSKAVDIEDEVLPFSLELTDEGVEDAEVIAKKLVITNENASIVDTGITDLVVVKEIVHSVQAKVYFVGSKGVLKTFLVDADDPWLDELEAKDLGGLQTKNNAIKRLKPIGRMYTDAFTRYQDYNNGNYEDVLLQVLNPKGKYDLLNLSSEEYFEYNCDGFNIGIGSSYATSPNFIICR